MAFMAERSMRKLFYFLAIFWVHPAHLTRYIYPRGVVEKRLKNTLAQNYDFVQLC